MKVRANAVGFYDNVLRKVGEEFEIKDESEMGKWMDVLEPPKKRRGRPPKVRPPEDVPVSDE